MKRVFYFLFLLIVFAACGSKKNQPNVSGIKISLPVERFENDFFALDTLQIQASLQKLKQSHPGFTDDFLFNILAVTPESSAKDLPAFLRTYASMHQDAIKKFGNLQETTEQVKKGLQLVHYYFPDYKLPKKLITFIGPINSYANIITPDALAVGLQLYLGSDYPLYLSETGQQLYPTFISRRFEPAYIPVNCMRNIVDDIFPEKTSLSPLVEQMVESGKRLYLINRLLPELPDSLKTGYTQKQWSGCIESEKNIWSFFIQNDLLFKTDPNLTRDYMSDGPNTPALGEASPGNIGQFVGIQIVNKWMEKHPDLSLTQLMNTPARQLFEEAKYKPK